MAAAIEKELGVRVSLVEGARGAFEVIRDGTPVFSKLQRGRFPSSDREVLDALKA